MQYYALRSRDFFPLHTDYIVGRFHCIVNADFFWLQVNAFQCTGLPLLVMQNRFSILPVDNISEIEEPFDTPEDVQTIKIKPENAPTPRVLRPRWEKKRLTAHFVVDALDETEGRRRSLTLKIELQTTDTGETKSVTALLDSGATGMFIDREYVRTNRLSTRTLSHPIPVRNVDGTPNEAGSVHEVVELVLRYKNHSEKAFFAVTGLGKQNVIMGHSWLQKHNP